MSDRQTDTVTLAVSDAIHALWTLAPLQRLEALAELLDQLEPAQIATVRAARDPERSGLVDQSAWSRTKPKRPATWQEIADALGVTRSAAWQRFHNIDACPGCGDTAADHDLCGEAVEF